MNEDIVSFSLAKKLKEKGYQQDYNIFGYTLIYSNNTTIKYISDIGAYDKEYFGENIPCPTISQVLKWLREDKVISVEPYASASGWRVTICRAYHQDRCDAGGGTCLKREVIGYNDGGAFEKYEEAAIAGIEYVIDNLI